LLLGAVVGSVIFRAAGSEDDAPVVTVVHWTTGHLLRTGTDLRLLDAMAAEFNGADNRTAAGERVRVEVHYASGSVQAPELVSRINTGVPLNAALPDPTMVTPSASHWMVNVNYQTGQDIIDLSNTEARSIARTYVGIVTYREMANCLGWPNKEIGYADIIELREDPDGWSSYPCARAEWGKKPLVAFTDPTESDTGRAVLLTLYAMAAGKDPHELTQEDVNDPEVVDYVRRFQALVDHYMINTSAINTKLYQGPRFGHFVIMPEDNLIHLKDGTEVAYINGIEETAPPLEQSVVMIYPKEGSLLRENCACIVNAPWVTPGQKEAAELWFQFLREDEQQRSFMEAGFQPGTDLSTDGTKLSDPKYGLNMALPNKVLYAERADPAVAAAIDDAWEVVKRPAIVSLVVDTSGSMAGEKLEQAKQGLSRALDNMATNNLVGLIHFADTVTPLVEVGNLTEIKFTLGDSVRGLRAQGGTALYQAVAAGVEMADEAEGPEDAIRAVVVLTDGQANQGIKLTDVVELSSRTETSIPNCKGFADDAQCFDDRGAPVSLSDVVGTSLKIQTRYPVQIFFIGLGEADVQVGRILAEATGAEYQGTTEEDLAGVLEQFGKYF
jgi:Ca-activated chloride channel family protein